MACTCACGTRAFHAGWPVASTGVALGHRPVVRADDEHHDLGVEARHLLGRVLGPVEELGGRQPARDPRVVDGRDHAGRRRPACRATVRASRRASRRAIQSRSGASAVRRRAALVSSARRVVVGGAWSRAAGSVRRRRGFARRRAPPIGVAVVVEHARAAADRERRRRRARATGDERRDRASPIAVVRRGPMGAVARRRLGRGVRRRGMRVRQSTPEVRRVRAPGRAGCGRGRRRGRRASRSSSWRPCSTIRPSSSTRMRSACDDRREAVRDHERGAARERVGERALDRELRLGVEVRRRLVEDDDRGVLEQHAGDREPLLLAARHPVAALADHRVVAVGEARDQVVDARRRHASTSSASVASGRA